MNNKFSNNLKLIRKENNISQEELAEKMGVSRQSVSKWESGLAYPEMDKIIFICDTYDVNIDDLLHGDIKEIKNTEEVKKKENNFIESFLKYITDSVSLFFRMTFRCKIKCIFEILILSLILWGLGAIVYEILDSLIRNIISFFPDKVFGVVHSIFSSTLIFTLTLVGLVVILRIFKARYLDYYNKEDIDKVSKEKENDDKTSEPMAKENERIKYKKEDKIIIRDPNSKEYGFFRGLLKVFIFFVKCFALCFAISIAFVIIWSSFLFVLSFLICKSGLLFVGVMLCLLACTVGLVIILLTVLNFVFNRKTNKKIMIFTFVGSILLFGIGMGISSIGLTSFNMKSINYKLLDSRSTQLDMNPDIFFYEDVEYIEDNIDNIKITYEINKYAKMSISHTPDIYLYGYFDNHMEAFRYELKCFNNKNIVPMDDNIYNIKVYASKENIEILKNNYSNYYEKLNHEDE